MSDTLSRPRHVAIIMDGNGRWAEQRSKPRIAGHRAGVEAVRAAVAFASQQGIEALTLYAFSSENWRRPREEVSLLMELFMAVLSREVKKLHKNNIRLRIIGDISAFSQRLQERIDQAEQLTRNNTGLALNVAANYGGRWDIVRATRRLAERVANGALDPQMIDEHMLSQETCLSSLPAVDLLIRTGGEHRISNYLLWQIAYSELYFSPVFWPDFDAEEFSLAIDSFADRERRFGCTSSQVQKGRTAELIDEV